jgi:hypothetical protein
MPFGSWPVLVKRGRLKVSRRFPVHRKVGKTALLLGDESSIPLIEVPTRSTSPKPILLAKSQRAKLLAPPPSVVQTV